MKCMHLASAVLASLIVASVACAKDESENAGQTYDLPSFEAKAEYTLPVPTRVYMGKVDKALVGKTIKMKFRVTKKGRPWGVDSLVPFFALERREADFAAQMRGTLKNWRFDPALDQNGNPVEVRVILPIKVVERKGDLVAQYKLQLDKGS